VAEPPDEFTLLCERCGYVIEGIDEAGVCPECAKPVRESMPALARPGTPWQNKRSIRSFLATLRDMAVRPRPTLSLARIDARSSRALAIRTTLLAAGIWAIAPTIWAVVAWVFTFKSWFDFVLAWTRDLGTIGLYGLLGWLAAWCFLLTLTVIERAGVRLYGRMRGRRVTREVATTVCAHACIGWVGGALLTWIPLAIDLASSELSLWILCSPLSLFPRPAALRDPGVSRGAALSVCESRAGHQGGLASPLARGTDA